jgi:MFS family permease
MRVKVDITALGRTRGYEYLVRFLAGGAITVIAWLVAARFGAGVGGLFLAFPAIFPSTATLIASHEKRKKERAGRNGTKRARELAGADAAGAAMGAFGLIAFAATVSWAIAGHSTTFALSLATLAWGLVSFTIWEIRESIFRRFRARFSNPRAPLDEGDRASAERSRSHE